MTQTTLVGNVCGAVIGGCHPAGCCGRRGPAAMHVASIKTATQNAMRICGGPEYAQSVPVLPLRRQWLRNSLSAGRLEGSPLGVVSTVRQ